MTKNTAIINTLFIVALVLIISCAAKVPDVGLKGVTPEDITERIALFEDGIRSVKGLAKVRINTGREKVSYTQVTVAEEPDLLRLEALNPFGSTVGFVSSDGKYIYIISSDKRDLYPSDEAFDLSYVYPGLDLRITAESLVNLVLGRLPYKIYDSAYKAELTAEAGYLKLAFKDAQNGMENTLWVNHENYRVEKADFSLSDGRRASVSYEYFGSLVDGHYFPRSIYFETGELSINIIYEPDVELNGKVDRALFAPSPEAASFEKRTLENYN